MSATDLFSNEPSPQDIIMGMVPTIIPAVPENPREAFNVVYGLLHNELMLQLDAAIHEAYTTELREAYKDKHPKRKWDIVKAATECEDVYEKWRVITQQASEMLFAWRDEMKALLEDLAEKAEVLPGENWNLYRSISNSAYHTQGYGADRYAQKAVELDLPVAAQYGLEAEIRVRRLRDDPAWTGSPKTDVTYYEMWVKAEALDLWILKQKPGLDMVEFVTACWKNGTNPRVLCPMLPHGFEEEHGIDYWGNRDGSFPEPPA